MSVYLSLLPRNSIIKEGKRPVTMAPVKLWKSKHVCKSKYFLQTVKCKDSKYCSPFQLSHLKVVKDSFLPLRTSVTCTTTSGLKWVKRDVDAHYFSLIQNLAFQLKLEELATPLKNFPKGIPYNYSCPAAQNIIERQFCSKCGLYLPSIKEVSLHEQMHKKQKTTPTDIPSETPSKQSAKTVQPPRLRPECVAAQWQEGLLCVPVPGIRVDGTGWCQYWRSCHTSSFIYKVWCSNHWNPQGNLEWGVNFIFQ